MAGFPCYCTDAILKISTSNNAFFLLRIGLLAIFVAYANATKTVYCQMCTTNFPWLPCPPGKSEMHIMQEQYFFQTLPLSSNALLIKTAFPLGDSTILQFYGYASFARQKQRLYIEPLFNNR